MKPKLYDIRIDQVRYNDSSPTRNMVIVITDPELLEKTGGIVQGMSCLLYTSETITSPVLIPALRAGLCLSLIHI